MTIAVVLLAAAGLVVLFLGHRFFWLFVTMIGLGAGVVFAPQLLPGQSDMVHLIASLAGGFVAAMLALVLRKTAAGIAAFGLGAYFAFWILEFFSVSSFNRHQLEWWIVLVVGGAFAAILVFAAFDYGLIFVASVAGAMMIVEAVRAPLALSPASAILTFSVLLVIGLIAQTFLYKQA